MKEIEERRRAARRAGKNGESIDDAEWEDVDEHEREVFKTTGGYFEVPDTDAQVSAADLQIFEQMEKTKEVFKNPKKAIDAGDGAQDLAALIT